MITGDVGVMRGDDADYVAWALEPAHGFASVRVRFQSSTGVSVRVD